MVFLLLLTFLLLFNWFWDSGEFGNDLIEVSVWQFSFFMIPSLLGFWYLTFGFHISLSFATFQVVCLLLGIIQSHKNEAISLEA